MVVRLTEEGRLAYLEAKLGGGASKGWSIGCERLLVRVGNYESGVSPNFKIYTKEWEALRWLEDNGYLEVGDGK